MPFKRQRKPHFECQRKSFFFVFRCIEHLTIVKQLNTEKRKKLENVHFHIKIKEKHNFITRKIMKSTGTVVTSSLVLNCNSFRCKCMSKKFQTCQSFLLANFEGGKGEDMTSNSATILNDIRIGVCFSKSNELCTTLIIGNAYLEYF